MQKVTRVQAAAAAAARAKGQVVAQGMTKQMKLPPQINVSARLCVLGEGHTMSQGGILLGARSIQRRRVI
jgi:hypothetical protein